MNIINRRSIILIIALILSMALYVFRDAEYPAFLVLLFVLLFIGALLCVLITGRHVDVSVDCPTQGSKGNPAECTVKVRNASRIPILSSSADIMIENLLTGEKDVQKHSFSAAGGKTSEVKYTVKPEHCGCIRISAGDIRVSDPLKIFSKSATEEGSRALLSGQMYCMPEAVETAIISDDINIYNMESHKYSSISRGNDPSETFDIKDYERGDSFKAIHWKLSGKMDKPVVREFGLPIENNVMVIIDRNSGSVSAEEADKCTDFAGSLSYSLYTSQVNHTIGWFNHLSGMFETARVDSMDAFWAAMKGLISCPFGEDELSAVDRYIESDETKEYSGYILVSDNEDGIEKLMAYGQVKTYKPQDYR